MKNNLSKLLALVAAPLLMMGCSPGNSGTEDPGPSAASSISPGSASSSSIDEEDPAADSANGLVVATFNTGGGDPVEQRELLAENGVDIFGLQEINYNNIRFINEGVELTNPLPDYTQDPYVDSYFGEAVKFAGGGYGTATVANTKFLDTESTKFYMGNPSAEASKIYEDTFNAYDPRDEKTVEAFQALKEGINGEYLFEPRLFTRVLIEKDGKEIAFYNAHTTWEDVNANGDSIDIRAGQLKQLHEAMKSDTAEYVVAVGDFNINATSEMWIFQDDFTLGNGNNGVWMDTFVVEYDSMNVYSIDNIIVSNNIEIRDIRVVEEPVLSDHLPLIAELELQ